ncbi:Predicted metal-dependent phosphoesterase TrpH, contains PHP domain [Halorubrum aquaticum]|uniref:Predicted metal-dependent phosphoesterase TrpH, contains PHP domain n=1 Tax=Halorubrum aquaticum TaxID=387340 RepID=A0A1I3BJ91_9EURY|nr:PHP domain-containing protein [Halorubrum aquaticum]SFH62375.1 Predicted metal-dependent phosphoesterase TrpH, contains PHP domain [Halorubrum aquaticum]
MSSVTVRIDPHVHSEDSYDGHEPVELILEHAADIGLDAVVITDHDTMGESKRAAEIAPEYGLIGIPGVEVSTADGHLLAIGVDRMPPRGESYATTVSWIHDSGGVAVVPHPFQRSRHGVRRRDIPVPGSNADDDDGSDEADDGDGVIGSDTVDEVDAIEVFNAWLFTGYRNRRARRFAAIHGYPGVAASDAHHLNYVGRAFTELTVRDRASVDDVTAADVLAAIREGTTSASGKRAPVPMAARHYLIAAGRKSGYYARTGARRGVATTVRGAVEAVTMARVGLSQGAHRFGRALSWFR